MREVKAILVLGQFEGFDDGIFLEGKTDQLTVALSATLIRMILGASFVWIVAVVARKLPELRRAMRSKEGISNTAAGAFIGPFMGVTLSMVAVTYASAGVAQTLSLMPVLIIPIVWILYKQRTSLRGILGAVIAVIGVAILFLT